MSLEGNANFEFSGGVQSFISEDDTLCQECPELKVYIDEKFQHLAEILQARNATIMKALGIPPMEHRNEPITINHHPTNTNDNTCNKESKLREIVADFSVDINYETIDNTIEETGVKNTIQEVFWEDIIREAAPGVTLTSIISALPFLSEEDLATWDQRICKENEDVFILAIKSVIRNDVKKNFHLLLCKELVLDLNLEGKCGKARFKDFTNFYNALKKAIAKGNQLSGLDPDNCIREAFQYTKKLHYTKISTQRKKYNKDPLGGV